MTKSTPSLPSPWHRLLAITRTVALGIAFTCGTTCTDAAGQDDDQNLSSRHAALFGRLDRDGDGLVADNEVPQERAYLWQRLKRRSDANQDGVLSLNEFVIGLAPQEHTAMPPAANPKLGTANITRMFRALDKNGDGFLEASELPAERRQMFLKRVPPNGRPRINLEEFTKRVRSGESIEQRRARFLEVVDRNQDQRIQRNEVPHGLLQAFQKSDENQNGELEDDEVIAFARRARG